MKKLLLSFLFIGTTFTIQSQEAKPTKEQTIEFISNTLKGYNVTVSLPRGRTTFTDKLEIIDVVFEKCIVVLNMKNYEKRYLDGAYDGYNDQQYEFRINLKDIERIEIKNDVDFKQFLAFYCFNSKKLISSVSIYEEDNDNGEKQTINSSVSSCYVYAPNDEKLIKAFNHLRKLCGAPEPIKF